MSDTTPNWDTLSCCLRSLLSRYDLDLSRVGQAQRLEYQDFESIFYHIFDMIDSLDCRRKFKYTYPARNKEDRGKFIKDAAQFINDKKLTSGRVAASQLLMCGGEPFRKILGSLIKKAAQTQTMANVRRYTDPGSTPEPINLSLGDCYESTTQTRAFIRNKLVELKSEMENLKSLQDNSAKVKKETDETWELLSKKTLVSVTGNSKIKQVHDKLLAEFESNNARLNDVGKKIKEILLPNESSATSGRSPSTTEQNKRVSQIVKKMRECLAVDPEYLPENNDTMLINKISNGLTNVDNKLDEFISKWTLQQEKADEALMEQPEMKARYKFYENLIQFVDIKPISLDNAQDIKSPKLSDIQAILNEYQDPRYDDNEILEISKEHFQD